MDQEFIIKDLNPCKTGGQHAGTPRRGMSITHSSGVSISCPPDCESRSQWRTRTALLDGLKLALTGLDIDYEVAPIRQFSRYAWELYSSLEQIIAAHKTGRYEPLQAAIEAALAKMEQQL